MSNNALLGSTINWPGKGIYGMKSSVLQTTENSLVKQEIISDHMKNHYRRLHGARSAIDTKPPKAMILGQKCRDRARKELAQLAYTQKMLDEFTASRPESARIATPRARSGHSARSMQRFAQSQPVTARARSRSIESARQLKRSLTMTGSMQNLHKKHNKEVDMADQLFGGGVLSQALTTMTALGKMTSTERNRSSADVLDKHPDSFYQPNPSEHRPRLVKRDADSHLRKNRAYYNPPSRLNKEASMSAKVAPEETKPKKSLEDEQSALREQLNRSLEIRDDVEKKIKKAKSKTKADSSLKKKSNATLQQFGLTEQERLQYVRFMQDLTDAIIRKDLTTESAIEKLFELHLDRHRGELDEKRLRQLLEALKQDLGVQTSRKGTSYATLERATVFDRDPLPPPVPSTTRDELMMLTPKTPHGDSRRSSFDVNSPFPWELERETPMQPVITPRTNPPLKNEIPREDPIDPLVDNLPLTSTIKPKPRFSLQNKLEESEQPDPSHIEEVPMQNELNFNATIRRPMTNLHDTDWLKDTGPETTDRIESSSPPIKPRKIIEEEEEENKSSVESDRFNENDYDDEEFDNPINEFD